MTGSEVDAPPAAGPPAPDDAPPVGGQPAPEAAETPWRGLHPASLVVNLIPQAWRTVRGAWPLLLALVFGSAQMGVDIFDLSLLLFFFAMALMRTTVHFLTLRYRVHAGRFEVRVGLLNRQARSLDPARIQNVSLVRNLFHRLSGLVEVRVETAGDTSSAGLLSALAVEEAEELQQALKALVRAADRAAAPAVEGEEDEPRTDEVGAALLRTGPLELVAYGFSRRTVGTVAVLTAVMMELVGRMGPEGADQVRWASQPKVLAAAVLLAFAGSWAWSAGTALFRHWGFTLARVGDLLVTTEGLATTRRVEIPLGKVQIVQAVEPLLRRLMGYGSVLIETAALGFADGQVRQAEGVLPMVERDDLRRICTATSPGAAVDPWSMELHPAHPRALYRAIVARAVRLAVLCAGLAWLVEPLRGWAFLGVLLALPLAWLDWRWQRWAVTERAIVARRGFLTRRTWIIDRAKLQSVYVHQGPLMRLHGLGVLEVRVAGTAVTLPTIGHAQALAVLEELRRR